MIPCPSVKVIGNAREFTTTVVQSRTKYTLKELVTDSKGKFEGTLWYVNVTDVASKDKSDVLICIPLLPD